MADEIDFRAKPPKLGSDVRRVNGEGFPTEYLMDQENKEQAWIEGTAVDLQTKITTVQAVADDASARVTDESIARAEGDEALAVRITTVEATAGSGFANGSLEFSASAAPTGYTAKYDLQLTAGDVKTGFSVLADSGGASAIMFSASQFLLTDPSYIGGGLGNVFYYSGGYFRFGVPVIFNTPEIEYNAVNTIQTAALSVDADFGSDGGTWHDVITLPASGGAGAYGFVVRYLTTNITVVGGGGASNIDTRVISDLGGEIMPPTGGFVGVAQDVGYEFSLPGATTYRLQVRNQTTFGGGRVIRFRAGTRLTAEVRFR